MKHWVVVLILMGLCVVTGVPKTIANLASHIGIGAPKYSFDSYNEETGDFALSETVYKQEELGITKEFIVYVIDTVLWRSIRNCQSAYIEEADSLNKATRYVKRRFLARLYKLRRRFIKYKPIVRFIDFLIDRYSSDTYPKP
ncbi:MAG: hypothetical protein ABII23_06295 [bacterium]